MDGQEKLLDYSRHGWYLLCVGCDLHCGTEKGR